MKIKKQIKTDKDYQLTVLERDNYSCLLCSRPAVCVHHVIGRRYKKIRHLEENGISVCQLCHNRIHNGNIKLEAIKEEMSLIYGAAWFKNLEKKAYQ